MLSEKHFILRMSKYGCWELWAFRLSCASIIQPQDHGAIKGLMSAHRWPEEGSKFPPVEDVPLKLVMTP